MFECLFWFFGQIVTQEVPPEESPACRGIASESPTCENCSNLLPSVVLQLFFYNLMDREISLSENCRFP